MVSSFERLFLGVAVFFLCSSAAHANVADKMCSDAALNWDKILKTAQYFYPDVSKKQLVQWQRLRSSCADAEQIQARYLVVKDKFEPAANKSSKARMKILVISPEDRAVKARYETLAKLRSLHLKTFNDLMSEIESLEQKEVKSAKSQVLSRVISCGMDRVERQSQILRAALAHDDFRGCVQQLDQYLPRTSGGAS